MVDSVQNPKHGALIRIAGASLLASLAAACGADTQRFAGNPFSNPFQTDPVQTGSLPPASEPHGIPASSAPVARAPLAAPTVASAPAVNPVRAAPMTGRADGWSAKGGTSITVAQGDTVQSLANRFGIPPAALASANGLKAGAALPPGSTIVIPVYNAAGVVAAPAKPMTARPAPAAPTPPAKVAATPRPAPAAQPRYQLTQGAKPANQQTPAPKVAAAPAAAPSAKLAPVKPVPAKPEQKVAAVETKPVQAPKSVPLSAKPVEAAPVAPAVERAPEKAAAPVETNVAAADKGESSSGDFRWPARGRVISGFNAKSNEGINIAVPEGTPVKAAEGGVVAYAGNELKGYGNLVLIRHDNGWVSAYANNGEIAVKRGEKVRRGQTIAKSGQTGNVSSPQLHFELRKGSTPVDPMPHLAAGG